MYAHAYTLKIRLLLLEYILLYRLFGQRLLGVAAECLRGNELRDSVGKLYSTTDGGSVWLLVQSLLYDAGSDVGLLGWALSGLNASS